MRPTALALVIGLAVAPATTGAAGVAGFSEESWFVVRIGGVPVGFASEIWRAEPGAVVYSARFKVSMRRMDTPLSMAIVTEEVTDPAGRLKSARMESSASRLETRAVLDGDTVRYESRTGSTTHQRSIPWDKAAVSSFVAERRVRAWLSGASPETTVTVFDVSMGDFHVTRLARGAASTDTIAGTPRRLVVVDEYEAGDVHPSSTTWYGEDGIAYRTLVRQLGIEIELERVDADDVGSIEVEPDFDILRRSMIPCHGFPSPASLARDVTLRLTFAGTLPARRLEGPNQAEVGRGDGWIDVRLTRATVRRERLPRDSLAVFVKPDRFAQSDSPVIVAVGDSLRAAVRAEGWPLVRAIAAWVNGHIVNKNFEEGYVSALDAYRTRAGDCTEHSLLLVAVLRAAGIPARPVVGLAYSESDRAFVGHMWAEAYVDHWRTLDALDLALDPVRIRVHAPRSDETVGERDLVRAYSEVAGVRIAVVEATRETPGSGGERR